MAKHSMRPKARSLRKLLDSGVILVAVGFVLLMAPLLLKGSSVLQSVSKGLQMAAWPSIAAGALLLLLYLILYRRAVNESRSFQHIEPKLRTESAGKSVWSQSVFSEIEWRRFEAVCERLFRQVGHITETRSHGADGGVDIWLKHEDLGAPIAIVQCKHWLRKAVGVKELREFYGVMASHQIKRGAFATSGRFTEDALAFARENGIETLDGQTLIKRILGRSEEQQRELLAVAYEGEYWKPTCASCGIKMIERTSSRDNSNFWGCRNYPRCKSIIRISPPLM